MREPLQITTAKRCLIPARNAKRLPRRPRAKPAADSATERSRFRSRLGLLRERSPLLGLDRLVLYQVPDFVDLLDKKLALENVAIVFVELGVDDGLDAAGPRRHHRNAVGEVNRLLHVMGNKDHRLWRALPDAQKLALH